MGVGLIMVLVFAIFCLFRRSTCRTRRRKRMGIRQQVGTMLSHSFRPWKECHSMQIRFWSCIFPDHCFGHVKHWAIVSLPQSRFLISFWFFSNYPSSFEPGWLALCYFGYWWFKLIFHFFSSPFHCRLLVFHSPWLGVIYVGVLLLVLERYIT